MKFHNLRRKWVGKAFGNILAPTAIICEGSEARKSRMGAYSRLKPYTELRASSLGDYSVVGPRSMANASDIGKFNSIGPGVHIGLWEHNQWVSTHAFYLSEACGGLVKGFKDFEKDRLRVTIGHDVWIGANVVVLKGVSVGTGAILGAGAIVTKDVPPYAIVVGNPARVLRYRFPPKDIEYLLELRWWDLDRKTLSTMAKAGVWDSIEKMKAFLGRGSP